MQGAQLKLQHGSKSEHFRAFQGFTGKAEERISCAATWVHNELKVRLESPSSTYLVLVHGCNQTFKTARRPDGRQQFLKIEIERTSARRDVSVRGRDAKLVLGPPVCQTDKFHPGVRVIVDEVSV